MELRIEVDRMSKIINDYFKKFEGNQIEEIGRLLELGIIVSERVQSSQDIDFVKKEVEGMLNTFDKRLSEQFGVSEKEFNKFLFENLSPDNDSSYLFKMKLWFRDELQRVKDISDLMIKNAKEISTDKLTMIESGIKEANENFDPSKEESYLGRFKSVVLDTALKISELLNPNDTESFAYKLNKEMEKYFGTGSPVLYEVANIIKEQEDNIKGELIKLREEIAKQQGASDIMEKTAIKGFRFENELMDDLEEIAHPYGDQVNKIGTKSVAGGSKKGDFIYEVENDFRIVIEAKDEIIGLKSMLKYLDEAMQTRSCDFSILVTKRADQLPKQVGLFNMYEGNKLFCSSDFIKFAIRWVRLYLTNVKGEVVEGVDAVAIENSIESINKHMKNFVTLKKKLTGLSNATNSTLLEANGVLTEIQNDIEIDLDEITNEIKKVKS